MRLLEVLLCRADAAAQCYRCGCVRTRATNADLLVQLGAQSTLWSLHAALAADFWLRPTEGLSEAITELSLAAGLGEWFCLHGTSLAPRRSHFGSRDAGAVVGGRGCRDPRSTRPTELSERRGQREPWCDRPVIIASDDQAFATEVRLQLATIDQLRVVLLEEFALRRYGTRLIISWRQRG